MPVQIASIMIPKVGQTYALLEDIFLKGGFRSVGSMADLDVDPTCLKTGMLAYVRDADAFFQLRSDGTWQRALDAVAGEQGVKGDKGDNGLDGATWHVVVAAPLSTMGKEGDFALNRLTFDVYRRGATAWGSPLLNIKGEKGEDGGQGLQGEKGDTGAAGDRWISSSGAPTGAAVDGTWCVDRLNADVYQRQEGTWNFVVNIRGTKGADGADGNDGRDGLNGLNGKDGRNIVNRQLFVANSTYSSNEFVLDEGSVAGTQSIWVCRKDNYTAQNQPRFDPASWFEIAGLQGATGEKGDTGDTGRAAQWLSGVGSPNAALGAVGDGYISSIGDLHYKTVGGWQFIRNLVGAKGDSGKSAFWFVIESPMPADGQDGDMCLSTNGKVLRKEAGAWVQKTSIRGHYWHRFANAGAITGGADGDLALLDNGDVYKNNAGSWSLSLNIRGLKGDKGDDGADGTNGVAGLNGLDGASILGGDGKPSNSYGVDDDHYIDYLTGDLYNKLNGIWSAVMNLRGIQGVKGDKGDKGDTGTFDQNTVVMPFHIPFTTFGGVGTNGGICGRFYAPCPISFKANLPNGHFAVAGTAPTTEQIFTLEINGQTVGSIKWVANTTVGVITWSQDRNMAVADKLEVRNPGSVDPALSDIYISLTGAAHAPAVTM